MNKKYLGISIIMALTVSLGACASKSDDVSDTPLNEFLVTTSIDLTCTMDDLAQNEQYIKLASGSAELGEMLSELGAGEYTSPSQAVLITFSDETADHIIKNITGELNLSDDAYDMVSARMLSSIPSYLNARQGTETLASTSLLTASKTFMQHKDFDANTYVILIYEHYASAAFFRNPAEGITSVSSSFLFLDEELQGYVTDKNVLDYLSQMFGVSEFEVEYISGDDMADYR